LVALGLVIAAAVLVLAGKEPPFSYGEPEVVGSVPWFDPGTHQGVLGFVPEVGAGPMGFVPGQQGEIFVADTVRSRVVRFAPEELTEIHTELQGRPLRPERLAISPAGDLYVVTDDGYVLRYDTSANLKGSFCLKPDPGNAGAIWAVQRISFLSDDRIAVADSWLHGEGYFRRVALYDPSGNLVDVLGGFTMNPQGEISGLSQDAGPRIVVDLAGAQGHLFVLERGTSGEGYSITSPVGSGWSIDPGCAEPSLLGIDGRHRLYVAGATPPGLKVIRYDVSGRVTGEEIVDLPDTPWHAAVDAKGNLYIAHYGQDAYVIRRYSLGG
jgi:sugar lactone lactonase YvrE